MQNFPTVGLIDGTFRQNLEEMGMGYAHEVEMIRAAHAKKLLTKPYVFSAEDAVAMAEAGADILVSHMGLTMGGAIGAETARTLDDCVGRIDGWAEVARRVRPDLLVLCHGGPIASPEDAAFVLGKAKACDGFTGASSMERLPTEIALTEQTRRFKAIAWSEKGAQASQEASLPTAKRKASPKARFPRSAKVGVAYSAASTAAGAVFIATPIF